MFENSVLIKILKIVSRAGIAVTYICNIISVNKVNCPVFLLLFCKNMMPYYSRESKSYRNIRILLDFNEILFSKRDTGFAKRNIEKSKKTAAIERNKNDDFFMNKETGLI